MSQSASSSNNVVGFGGEMEGLVGGLEMRMGNWSLLHKSG